MKVLSRGFRAVQITSCSWSFGFYRSIILYDFFFSHRLLYFCILITPLISGHNCSNSSSRRSTRHNIKNFWTVLFKPPITTPKIQHQYSDTKCSVSLHHTHKVINLLETYGLQDISSHVLNSDRTILFFLASCIPAWRNIHTEFRCLLILLYEFYLAVPDHI